MKIKQSKGFLVFAKKTHIIKIFLLVLRYLKPLLKTIFIPKKTGLYKYKNYDEYKKMQIEGNIEGIKSNRCWATENNIKFLSNFLKKEVPNLKFGICHGTRQGKEQEWFSKYSGIPVIGTEISPTATVFPNTIQWDFHNVKDEWVNNVDFIYSNSFDHSYNPEACLDAWMKCITENGVVILEWTPAHVEYNELDPFGATLKDYKKLISKKYNLVKILKSPDNHFWRLRKTYFLIVSHKKEKESKYQNKLHIIRICKGY